MRKNFFVFCGIVVAVCQCLTGCWDKVEIENRGFVVSMGIDKCNDEKQQESEASRYVISIALPNTEAMASPGGEEEKKSVKKVSHQTVAAALGRMDSSSGQKLYFGQTKVAVWGKEVLEDEALFQEAVDALERNSEISRKLIMLSSEEDALEALNAKAQGEPLMGLFVSNYFQNKKRSSATFRLDLEELSEQLERGACVIPKIKGSDKEIKLEGAAVMKDYKLAGWLTDNQTRGYLWMKGKATGTLIPVAFQENHLTLRVDKNKTRIHFYEEAEQTRCVVDIVAEGVLEEGTAEDMEAFCRAGEEMICSEVLDTVRAFQEDFQTDGFGFGELYRKYRGGQPQPFTQFIIEPRVKVTVHGTGSVL